MNYWQKLALKLKEEGFEDDYIEIFMQLFNSVPIKELLQASPMEIAQTINLYSGSSFMAMPDDVSDILMIAKRLYQQMQLVHDTSVDPVIPSEHHKPHEDDKLTKTYTIKGKIVNEKGVGVSALYVEILKLGIPGVDKKEKILAKPVQTQENGSYKIEIPRSKLSRNLDIIIRVSNSHNKKLHEVEKYDIADINKINITIPIDDYRGKSEFEKIGEAIGEVLPKDYDLESIKETDEERGITYLSRKTRYDARLIAMYVLAHKYAKKREGLLSEFYYVLFRAGIPSEDNILYRTNVSNAIELFETAVSKNIVPDKKLDISHVKKVFQSQVLHSKSPMSMSTMDEMLSLSLSKSEDKEAFISHYLSGSDLNETLEKMKDQIDSKVAQKIKLDAQLGYLTFNNVELIETLKSNFTLNDPIDLVKKGLYKDDAWKKYTSHIDAKTIPTIFESDVSKYIQWIVAQLQMSFPTAVVAEKINNRDEIELGVNANIKKEIKNALYANNFALSETSINQHINDLKITDKQVIKELQRIHRAYQLSPSDDVMNILLINNFDSAFKITKITKEKFVNHKSFSANRKDAELVYEKAIADASLITNVTMSYLTQAVNPLPAAVAPMIHNSPASSISKYPKLEELFGSLDFCTCGHCESILSPAAYLVDLLHFIDPNPSDKKSEYPIDKLLQRRPDIEYMDLSCENTMTVLPYIDLVNEIMEYYVVNKSLASFKGHNTTEVMKSSELLAEPAYVESEAYNILKNEVYPLSVPFNYFLEYTREIFKKMGIPFYELLETMRKDESFVPEAGYGWRDIFCEQLNVSPELYGIFTDSAHHPISKLYGYEGTLLANDVYNAKKFTQVTDIEYDELVSLLKTEFINPNRELIPKLEILQTIFNTSKVDDEGTRSRFGKKTLLQVLKGPTDFDEIFRLSEEQAMEFDNDLKQWVKDNYTPIEKMIFLTDGLLAKLAILQTIFDKSKANDEDIRSRFGDTTLLQILKEFENGHIGEADFDKIFPLSEAQKMKFDNDLKLWVKNNYNAIDKIDDNIKSCDFEEYKLSYFNGNELEDIEYWKFIRFIRFWKHFEWSIKKTDKVIEILTNLASKIDIESDESEKVKILDQGFTDLIIRLAILERVQKVLGDESNETFDLLLELWKYIAEAEKENGYELLARLLEINIEEIYAIKVLSGIDPLESFYYLDGDNHDGNTYKEPNILAFVSIAEKIKESGFSVTELNYLFRNIDASGEASPKYEEYYGLFKTLSSGLQEIEKRYSTAEENEITQEKAVELLTAVFGKEDANIMQGIFSDTIVFTTAYSHTSDTLDIDMINVDSRIAYDDSKKELSFKGMMNSDIRDAFKGVLGVSDTFIVAIDELHFLGIAGLSTTIVLTTDYTQLSETLEDGITTIDSRLSYDYTNGKLSFYGKMRQEIQTSFKNVSGVSNEFKDAIGRLYEEGERTYQSFFIAHPEFEEIHNMYTSLAKIISATLPSLVKRLKYSYIQQSLSAQLKFDTDIIGLLLKSKIDESYLLNSAVEADKPMINDFIAIESQGIVTSVDSEWQFYLAPEVTSNYNLYFNILDSSFIPAGDTLLIDDVRVEVNINRDGNLKNKYVISFEAGKTYEIKINAPFEPNAVLKWKQGDRLKETIPKRLLISYEIMQNFKHSYTKLLKVLQLIKGLNLSVESIEYLSHQHGASFVKNIPYNDSIRLSHTQILFSLFLEIIKYNTLNIQLKIKDDSLIQFFEAPNKTFKVENDDRSIFYHAVSWNKEDLDAIVKHFKDDDTLTDTEAELVDITLLSKTTRVFELLESLGIAAEDLISCSTPYISNTEIAEIFQARYDKEAWLKMSQAINDKMRISQRDALVSYVLNILHKDELTKDIDTADKLFEYFLIDVEMDSCMRTSRIKQAISSVQLFIDRCLYNLEAGIFPTSINAEQWEWMKRYRIWEANRKVFLYPENWLDPSLRTTKSPFFKEFEGEMLQSDINDDLATKSLLNYLEKVDQVSQLEICGMCRENANDSKSTIHVIGRTAGMRREYYHRRYDGTWSAWEKITVDAEDGPVIPVYWKGRLFLFWTTTLQKGKMQEKSNDTVNDNLEKIQGAPEFNIEVNLCWSEYYNRKWQAKHTTDFNDPIIINDVIGKFDRNDIELEYFEKENRYLTVGIFHKNINHGDFFYFNTQSLPKKDTSKKGKNKYREINFIKRRKIRHIINSDENGKWLKFGYAKLLRVELSDNGISKYFDYEEDVILNDYFYKITDFAHPFADIFSDPFFLNDNKYSFFVDVDKGNRFIKDINTFGSDIVLEIDSWKIPDLRKPPKPGQVMQDWGVPMNDIAFNFMGSYIGLNGKIDKSRKTL